MSPTADLSSVGSAKEEGCSEGGELEPRISLMARMNTTLA